LIALAAALPLLGCDGGQERVRQAVLRVLRADRQLFDTHKPPPDANPPQVAWVVGCYCDALERLDMSDCPADFRIAYRHHIRAWREAKSVVEGLPKGFWSGFFLGLKNAVLRGEGDGGQSRLEGDLKRAQDGVSQSWREVERIAAKYGAVL
jgi:hypothetical protein